MFSLVCQALMLFFLAFHSKKWIFWKLHFYVIRSLTIMSCTLWNKVSEITELWVVQWKMSFFSARERIFASYFDVSLLIFYLLCLQHFLSCFSCKFLFEKGSFCFCTILILRLKTVCVSVFWNCAGLLLQGSKLNFIEMATTNSSSKHPFQNAERKPLF